MIAGILLFLKGVPAWASQALAVIALLFGVLMYGEHRQASKDAVKITAAKKEFADFKDSVERQGKAAQQAADKQKAADIVAKENADASHSKAISDLNADIARLRKQRSPGGFVPAPPPNSRRPDLICFDRAAYIAADGKFTTGARGLADEGAAATVDLNTAKLWAH